MRNIRQNLFFALAYNGIGIPVAVSSLSVVVNANRLRRYRPAPLPDAQVAHVEPLIQVGDADDTYAAGQDSARFAHRGSGRCGRREAKATGPGDTGRTSLLYAIRVRGQSLSSVR
jgi:hypothetical protein